MNRPSKPETLAFGSVSEGEDHGVKTELRAFGPILLFVGEKDVVHAALVVERQDAWKEYDIKGAFPHDECYVKTNGEKVKIPDRVVPDFSQKGLNMFVADKEALENLPSAYVVRRVTTPRSLQQMYEVKASPQNALIDGCSPSSYQFYFIEHTAFRFSVTREFIEDKDIVKELNMMVLATTDLRQSYVLGQTFLAQLVKDGADARKWKIVSKVQQCDATEDFPDVASEKVKSKLGFRTSTAALTYKKGPLSTCSQFGIVTKKKKTYYALDSSSAKDASVEDAFAFSKTDTGDMTFDVAVPFAALRLAWEQPDAFSSFFKKNVRSCPSTVMASLYTDTELTQPMVDGGGLDLMSDECPAVVFTVTFNDKGLIKMGTEVVHIPKGQITKVSWAKAEQELKKGEWQEIERASEVLSRHSLTGHSLKGVLLPSRKVLIGCEKKKQTSVISDHTASRVKPMLDAILSTVPVVAGWCLRQDDGGEKGDGREAFPVFERRPHINVPQLLAARDSMPDEISEQRNKIHGATDVERWRILKEVKATVAEQLRKAGPSTDKWLALACRLKDVEGWPVQGCEAGSGTPLPLYTTVKSFKQTANRSCAVKAPLRKMDALVNQFHLLKRLVHDQKVPCTDTTRGTIKTNIEFFFKTLFGKGATSIKDSTHRIIRDAWMARKYAQETMGITSLVAGAAMERVSKVYVEGIRWDDTEEKKPYNVTLTEVMGGFSQPILLQNLACYGDARRVDDTVEVELESVDLPPLVFRRDGIFTVTIVTFTNQGQYKSCLKSIWLDPSGDDEAVLPVQHLEQCNGGIFASTPFSTPGPMAKEEFQSDAALYQASLIAEASREAARGAVHGDKKVSAGWGRLYRASHSTLSHSVTLSASLAKELTDETPRDIVVVLMGVRKTTYRDLHDQGTDQEIEQPFTVYTFGTWSKEDGKEIRFHEERLRSDSRVAVEALSKGPLEGFNVRVHFWPRSSNSNAVLFALKRFDTSRPLFYNASDTPGNALAASQEEVAFMEQQPRSLFNAVQKDCYESCLTKPLTVLTGTAGTGKSEVILAAAVVTALRCRNGGCVAVLSQGNDIVDKLFMKTQEMIERGLLNLRIVRLSSLTHKNTCVGDVAAELKTEDEIDVSGGKVSIVFTTIDLYNMHKKKTIEQGEASIMAAAETLIIDEAGMCNEEALVSAGILSEGLNHLVLCGDVEQNGPVRLGRQAVQDMFSFSVMERLVATRSIKEVFTLTMTYRCKARDLARACTDLFSISTSVKKKTTFAIPKRDKRFYKNEDTAKPEELDNLPSAAYHFLPDSDTPNEQQAGTSFCNRAQANAALCILHYLSTLRVNKDNKEKTKVLIVAPYNEQVNRIHDQVVKVRAQFPLLDERLEITVRSAANCQGFEHDVAIVSFVRSEQRNSRPCGKEFITPKLIRTALSRPTMQCIVIAGQTWADKMPLLKRIAEPDAKWEGGNPWKKLAIEGLSFSQDYITGWDAPREDVPKSPQRREPSVGNVFVGEGWVEVPIDCLEESEGLRALLLKERPRGQWCTNDVCSYRDCAFIHPKVCSFHSVLPSGFAGLRVYGFAVPFSIIRGWHCGLVGSAC